MRCCAFLLALCVVFAPAACAESVSQPEMLLTETFETVAEGALPEGWQPAGGNWSVTQGRLRGEATVYLSKILLPTPAQSDLAFEADVAFERASDAGRWVALAVRNPEGAGAPHLQFTHRFDRRQPNGLEFGWLASHEPVKWSVLSVGSADIAPELGKAHRLRFEVRGWQARGFIDDELVLEQPLSPNALVAGRLALIISGATATFDNIRVWKLPALGAEELDRLLEQTCTTPLVIAHRGNSLHAPENTLEAIRQAIDAGADLVEVDVNMSKDGVVVLMHDYTVDRTTNGKGKVSDLTLAELKALDAGAWKDPKYAGERIPTLEEACRLAKGKMPLVLDLKGNGYAEEIAEVVNRLEMSDQIIAACWTLEQAANIQRHLPLVVCKRILPRGTPEQMADPGSINTHLQAGLRGFSCYNRILSPLFIRAARRRAMPVFAWTVNDPGEMERMAMLGVDGIYTDDPVTLRQVLANLRRRTWTPAPPP